MTSPIRLLTLTEFEPLRIPRHDLPMEVGAAIWRLYQRYIDVEFPSLKNNDHWVFESRGVVGYLPVNDDITVRIQPRVPIANIFAMWAIAHRIDLTWLTSEVQVTSIEELYSRIASQLARLVLQRVRRGLYRNYVDRRDFLLYVRGRVDLAERLRKPWNVQLQCEFQEHTSNIEDNQILLAALRVAASAAACTGNALAVVRKAYWDLQGMVELVPIPAASCIGRSYNRLNADYQLMHWLAHFLLEYSSPNHETGSKSILPFVINMPRLFERFVAAWLVQHSPRGCDIQSQKQLHIVDQISFQPDIVFRSRSSGHAVVVLDTKYKADINPSADDIAQIVAYAERLGCTRAGLVYPTNLPRHLRFSVGQMSVQQFSFPLDGSLNAAGNSFLHELCETLLLAETGAA